MKIASRREGASGAASRLVIVTAAIVFAGLAIIDAPAPGYALAGFAIVAAAAFLAMRAAEEVGRLARPVAVAERAGEPLEAVVAGLPDPVIALDRERPCARAQRPRAFAGAGVAAGRAGFAGAAHA